MGDAREILMGLSMINAGLQSTNKLVGDLRGGNPYAFNNFFFNMGGSMARIDFADRAARHGNYMPYAFNSVVPFTDTYANSWALASNWFTPRIGCCGRFRPMPLWGCGSFGWFC